MTNPIIKLIAETWPNAEDQTNDGQLNANDETGDVPMEDITKIVRR